MAEPSAIDIDWDASAATLGGYADFMAKEIAEQPEAIERLLSGRLGEKGILLDELKMTEEELAAVDRIYLIACGTSYHVGLIARTLIQTWAQGPRHLRLRLRVQLRAGRPGDRPHPVRCHHAVRRDGRHAGRRPQRRTRWVPRSLPSPTSWALPPARESDGVLYVQAGHRGLRVLHQGLHGPDGCLRPLCPAPGPEPRCHERRGGRGPLPGPQGHPGRHPRGASRAPGRTSRPRRSSAAPPQPSSWAAASTPPPPTRAPSSSRRSATCTPRPIPPAR